MSAPTIAELKGYALACHRAGRVLRKPMPETERAALQEKYPTIPIVDGRTEHLAQLERLFAAAYTLLNATQVRINEAKAASTERTRGET